MSCSATNTPLANRKASIVWADVDPRSGLIDPEDVAKKLTKKTKAIVAVDWQGSMCNYQALRKVASGIPIVEDAAHAFGAVWDDKTPASAGADYICYSFQAIKHLTTVDGGALIVPRDNVDRAKRLRWFGLDRSQPEDRRFAQDIPETGFKYHMNDVNAAIGLGNGAAAIHAVGRHRRNSDYLSSRLDKFKFPTGTFLGTTYSFLDNGSSRWIYTIFVDSPERFQIFMRRRGIVVSQVHKRNDEHTGFKTVKKLRAPLVGLDYFSKHQVAIPCGHWLSTNDLELIANAVEDYAKGLI